MTSDPSLHLFGHPDSGHAYKVRLALSIAGIAHRYSEVDIWASRESRPDLFRRNARHHEVPLLLDGGQALCQSDAILVFLARKYGVLGGQDDQALQSCLEWLFWEANRLGMCVPQLRAANRFTAFALDAGARRWLTDRCNADLAALAAVFDDGRPFIIGSQPTIADFSLCGYLFYGDEAGVDLPAPVCRWLERIAQLPGWQGPYALMKSASQAQLQP